jgi:RNA polymerase sigma factor for flagellar operon FliA
MKNTRTKDTLKHSKQSVEEQNSHINNREENIRLWNRYNAKNKPQHLREQLIKKYAYLVNWVIGRFPPMDSADFDREDLLGYGTIGLIEAIDRYDVSQKCTFETFAINRVRGEILDFLRSRDFLTRTGRDRVKKFNQALAKLELELGRTPTEEEIKKNLNINSENLRLIKSEAAATVFSLDSTERPRSLNDTSSDTLLDSIPSDIVTQEEYTEANLLRERLAKAIDSLGKRERLVVALYHYQKLTFKEIGEVLDISESRANQLHMKAIQRLRTIMKDFDPNS